MAAVGGSTYYLRIRKRNQSRAFGLYLDSDNQLGADQKRTAGRIRRSSYRGGRAIVAAAAAPAVHVVLHDDASTDGTAAAPKTA